MWPSQTGLKAALMEKIPSLSPKQTLLMQFILENLSYVAFASAEEVGSKVGVSAATVVRLCQNLGYKGYSEFQEAVRQTFPSYSATIRQVEKKQLGEASGLAEEVFSLNSANLSETLSNISQEELNEAVEAVYNARSILVCGVGLSASLALFLGKSLKIMGFPAKELVSGGIDIALEMAHLNPSDMVVGIGFWRYVRDTTRLMERAKEIGSTTMAITDSLASPLARFADYKFVVVTESLSHSISLTAAMSFIDLFIAALLHRDPHRGSEALRRTNLAYEESDLLMPVSAHRGRKPSERSRESGG